MRDSPREILATLPKRIRRGLDALDPRTVRLSEPAPRFKKLLWAMDPRTVRLKEPTTSRLKRNGLIAVAAAAFLGAGAVAVASTGKEAPNEASPSPAHYSYSEPEGSYDPGPPAAGEPSQPLLQETDKEEAAPVAKPPDFYNPIYVFTDEPAGKVNAYPLKEPPGIVVNLDGTPEPEVEAKEMVGDDPRVRSVRRRTTSTGIRYIIGLKTPVKRIQVVTEGNVVMIAPVE